jgi:nucleotide-binding universal stress UspA family protein
MPLLATSKNVVILTVGEHDRVTEESAGKLMDALRWHGFNVSARHLHDGQGSAADTLLAAANDQGAGLLVMGGYGHSRFEELVLGGFTRQVLGSAELPVLMMH